MNNYRLVYHKLKTKLLKSKVQEILFIIYFAFFLSLSIGCDGVSNEVEGSYEGTTEMGYYSGFSKLKIENDYSAVLSYRYNGLEGEEIEYGKIINENGKYYFSSKEGSKYPLFFEDSRVRLKGNSWSCDMERQN